MILTVLSVAIGGGFGAVCRAALSNWIKSRWCHAFPIATFLINILGSFALGILAAISLSTSTVYALCGTGFLGGFTTFSTLHVEAFTLIRSGKSSICSQYLFLSYLCGIAASVVGLMVGGQ